MLADRLISLLIGGNVVGDAARLRLNGICSHAHLQLENCYHRKLGAVCQERSNSPTSRCEGGAAREAFVLVS